MLILDNYFRSASSFPFGVSLSSELNSSVCIQVIVSFQSYLWIPTFLGWSQTLLFASQNHWHNGPLSSWFPSRHPSLGPVILCLVLAASTRFHNDVIGLTLLLMVKKSLGPSLFQISLESPWNKGFPLSCWVERDELILSAEMSVCKNSILEQICWGEETIWCDW